MIDSRDYMREPEYRPNSNRWKTATGILLIINVAVYGAMAAARIIAPKLPLDTFLSLSVGGLKQGYVWQLLSFQFLHANLLHLVLNSLGIFGLGFAVERFLGVKRFIALYLVSGVIGGLLQVLGQFLLPGIVGQGEVVGASAGVFGLIAAFAMMAPEDDLTVYLFFVFPVTVSVKVFATVFLGISLLGMLFEAYGLSRSSVAHASHAGGMLGGWLMLRYYRSRPIYETNEREETSPKRTKPAKMETDFLNKEVDTILDKISKKGIHSLTDAERKTLEDARKKLEKR